MDSNLLRKSLLVVTLFIAVIFAVILAANGYLEKSSGNTVTETTQQDTEAADESGQVNGSDLSAWMSDETFFDVEKSKTLQSLESAASTLSLITSSVEKDLRIYVVDGNGKTVTGCNFSVAVSDMGNFSDVNRDGIIYIGDMKPGEYQITLKETEGYTVPDEPVFASVKENIEYCAIDDISYLIKTEAEIDATKEDTAVNDAATETSGTSAVKTQEGAVFGIDVSKWNGTIDWVKVKQDGVGFAIIRAGYRGASTGSIVVDPFFESNMEGAAAAGIPVGVYFFTQATNEVEAVEEASSVLSLITKYKLDYPIFIDSEGAGGNGRADSLDAKQRSLACQAFCETIRSGGYDAGIYASRNWLNKRLDITKFSADNRIWLAEYNDKPSYGGTYQMWQYTSNGRVNGIEGRVDFNLSYLEEPDSTDKSDTKQSGQTQPEKSGAENSEEQQNKGPAGQPENINNEENENGKNNRGNV